MSCAESVCNWNQLLICSTLACPHISYGSIDRWANYSGWFLVPLSSCFVSYFLFVHVQMKQRKNPSQLFFDIIHHLTRSPNSGISHLGKGTKKKIPLSPPLVHTTWNHSTLPHTCAYKTFLFLCILEQTRSLIWLSLESTASPSPQTRLSAASAVLCNLLKRADRVLGTKRRLQVYIYHYAATCSGIERLKKKNMTFKYLWAKMQSIFYRFEMIIWNALKWALHLKLAAHYVPAHTWMPL